MAATTTPRRQFHFEPLEERVAPTWFLAALGLDAIAVIGAGGASGALPLSEASVADLRSSLVIATRDTALVDAVIYDGPERRQKPRPKTHETLVNDVLHTLDREYNK